MQFSLLSVALKNLKRKSFRTLLLVISIGLLVSILVFGGSFILTVSAGIERASGRLGADLLVVPAGAREYAQEVLLETEVKTFYMKRALMDRIAKVDGIKDMTFQIYLSTILGVCCDIPAAKVILFNQETDFIVKPWLNKVIDRPLKKQEVIVGWETFKNFDLLDVDRSVFYNMVFDIVGVLEKTGTGLDNALLMSDENLEEIIAKSGVDIGNDVVSVVFTRVEAGKDPEKVGRLVEGEMVEVDVIPRNQMGKRILNNLHDINKVFLITIMLATLLSTFLAWNVFSAIANERMREIGIMMAIGARGRHVVIIFVLEVLILGIAGSLVGIVFGTYLSIALENFFSLLRDLPFTLEISERVIVSCIGLLVGCGICLSGALSSIVRLLKLDPITALKEV